MFTKRNLSAVALAVAVAVPLAAQGNGGARDAQAAVDAAQRRSQIDSARAAARRRADVEGARTAQARIEAARAEARGNRGVHARVPRGHLPPRGMCRVWIDGVPPGQQPPVTSCAQAERDRFAYGARARVIYGDRESFPGKGNGKFKRSGSQTAASCVLRDAVVLADGRVVNLCRDANGNIIGRDGRVLRGDDRDDDDDDDDRFDDGDRGRSKSKAQKHKGKGRGGRGR